MNSASAKHLGGAKLVMFFALLACSMPHRPVVAATVGQDAAAYLVNQFGLNDRQAKGALGALLVFAREQLPKPQFDQLAARFPNADILMQIVQQQGVVTKPLDYISDYVRSLASLGIGEKVASQIAPAVVQFLGEAGFDEEQSILAGILR
jgi:hypothetical protein